METFPLIRTEEKCVSRRALWGVWEGVLAWFQNLDENSTFAIGPQIATNSRDIYQKYNRSHHHTWDDIWGVLFGSMDLMVDHTQFTPWEEVPESLIVGTKLPYGGSWGSFCDASAAVGAILLATITMDSFSSDLYPKPCSWMENRWNLIKLLMTSFHFHLITVSLPHISIYHSGNNTPNFDGTYSILYQCCWKFQDHVLWNPLSMLEKFPKT